MPASSLAANSRDEESPSAKTPLLDGRRLAELVGFLLTVAGLLTVLSLISYLPRDPSLHSTAPSGTNVHNWIGLVGAYGADMLFQGFGWVAGLLPLAFFVVGGFLLTGQPIQAPYIKLAGIVMMLGSVAALLEFFPYTPRVGGLIRGGGLLGYLLTLALVRIFNHVGAIIVAGTLLLTSLFLVTRFSFSATFHFSRDRASIFKPLVARWADWRERRRREKAKKQVEISRVIGKEPTVIQKVVSKAAATSAAPAPRAISVPPPGGAFTRPHANESNDPTRLRIPLPPVARARGLDFDEPAAVPPATKPAPRIVGRGAHGFKLPNSTLLRPPGAEQMIDEDELKERAQQLVQKFAEFDVTGAVTQIHPGPVVTTYEFKPEAGIKYSRITSLVDDLCLAMRAESILVERIPGKSTIGIEVPNVHRETIHLREGIESIEFAGSASKMSIFLGKDITGKIKVSDLSSMPHLMIAGSTGSGKSVAINSMIVSILYKATPDEVKMIMIDPKRLELGLYEDIPHLYTPIVTEPKQAANVLRRATLEMESRLKKLAEYGVRNIEQYNKMFEPDSNLNLFDSNGERQNPLPYLVIIIDELADLMMVEPQTVEESITRLAQMARAVGIHLILATQRPSVDVITGLIKANMPSRISFRVASKVDSRTILDSNGAEALLGRGDMLFMPPGSSRLLRLHSSLVTEKEIGKVVDWWKSQSQPSYNEEFLKPFRDRERDEETPEDEEIDEGLDEYYEDAVRIVVESGKASTSLLQRRLRLGYGRAARLLDMMEKDGIVSAPDGARPREVLKRPDWIHEVGSSLR
ncbi:MAG: DNA translocase FtsK [Acidobacteria bacterium]|nr:DNA translocase FtsK [Acidobacteriota bacterium]